MQLFCHRAYYEHEAFSCFHQSILDICLVQHRVDRVLLKGFDEMPLQYSNAIVDAWPVANHNQDTPIPLPLKKDIWEKRDTHWGLYKRV